jgi:hypothetical protein
VLVKSARRIADSFASHDHAALDDPAPGRDDQESQDAGSTLKVLP